MRTSYSYLLANLPLTTVVFAILILGRERQLCRLAVYSGLTCVPLSLTGLMYGEYWRPGGTSVWRTCSSHSPRARPRGFVRSGRTAGLCECHRMLRPTTW